MNQAKVQELIDKEVCSSETRRMVTCLSENKLIEKRQKLKFGRMPKRENNLVWPEDL